AGVGGGVAADEDVHGPTAVDVVEGGRGPDRIPVIHRGDRVAVAVEDVDAVVPGTEHDVVDPVAGHVADGRRAVDAGGHGLRAHQLLTAKGAIAVEDVEGPDGVVRGGAVQGARADDALVPAVAVEVADRRARGHRRRRPG